MVATSNPGKLREYRSLLADLPLEIVSLGDVGIDGAVEEIGETYAENAILKARAYAKQSGLLTLADDSGLEVDALHGEPGPRSSRFGGPGANDRQRVDLLLRGLSGVPWPRRAARFRAIVAIATPEGHVETFEGACEGIIALEPRGSQGFGYDPVFYLPTYGRTMAELPSELKNRISHRARAIRAAKATLANLTAGGYSSGAAPSA